MAAEIHRFIDYYDHSFIVKSILQQIICQKGAIDIYLYFPTLFNVVGKSASTLEKRLLIDEHSIIESHDRDEFREIAWIPGHQNPADALDKHGNSTNSPLYKLMTTKRMENIPQGGVHRCFDSENKMHSVSKPSPKPESMQWILLVATANWKVRIVRIYLNSHWVRTT